MTISFKMPTWASGRDTLLVLMTGLVVVLIVVVITMVRAGGGDQAASRNPGSGGAAPAPSAKASAANSNGQPTASAQATQSAQPAPSKQDDAAKQDDGTASGAGTSGTPAALRVTGASSYDPSGGTGFKSSGGEWVTQRYNSPTFGNLKPGLGLVLDLGAAHEVSTVTFNAGSGPLDIELKAGDDPGGSGYRSADKVTSAKGSTTLKGADGGEHRYWMIWVTKLGSGNTAGIKDITVKGT